MPTGSTFILRAVGFTYDVTMGLLQLAMARAFDEGLKQAVARQEWLYESLDIAA